MKLSYKLIGIAAVSKNGVIGIGDKLPWHIPEDLAWFKRVTLGHTLLMGRKTLDSIGKKLPGRKTIILTRTPLADDEIKSPDKINPEGGLVFLCGGAEIYSHYIFLCDELLITHVDLEIEGDKYLPYFLHKFREVETIKQTQSFCIKKYVRTSED